MDKHASRTGARIDVSFRFLARFRFAPQAVET